MIFDSWLVVVVVSLVVAPLFLCDVCGLLRSPYSLHTGVQQSEFALPCCALLMVFELPKDGGSTAAVFFSEQVGNTGTSKRLSTGGNLLAVGIVAAAVPVKEAPALRQIGHDEPWVRYSRMGSLSHVGLSDERVGRVVEDLVLQVAARTPTRSAPIEIHVLLQAVVVLQQENGPYRDRVVGGAVGIIVLLEPVDAFGA